MQLIADKTTIMCFHLTRVLWILFLQFHIQLDILRTLCMWPQIPPNDTSVLRVHRSMTQRISRLSAKFPIYCFWFLVFGLLYRHTASDSIATEMHTRRVQ